MATSDSSAPQRRRRNVGSSKAGRQDRNGLIAAAAPIPEDGGLFGMIFQNNLTFGKIASYLTVGDMKILGQVSHMALGQVRSNRKFGENVKLLVNNDSYDTVRKTEFHWKTISFELGTLQQNHEMISLKRILRHVEEIEIVDKSQQYEMSNTKWINCLQTVIASSPGLRKLALHQGLIEKKFLRVLKRTQVVAALANLRELDIFKEKGSNIPCIEKEQQADFAKVLQEILTKTNNLTLFRFGKIDTRNSAEINQAIVDIVEKSKETLTDLALSIQPWKHNNLRTLVCPLLSKLNIVFKSRDVDVIKTFLRNQPLLTSLKMQGLDECPLTLIASIKDYSSELRQLHLKVPALTNDVEVVEEVAPNGDIEVHIPPTFLDWTFLSNLTHLEDFAIIRCVDKEVHQDFDPDNLLDHVFVSSVLNNVPTNIKKLHLCGLDLTWPRVDETTPVIIAMLSRFTSLTELALFECPDTISDEILQFICSNFTKLRVLAFSRCGSLTSFGFSGVQQDLNTGVSISNLKGLRKLTIQDCSSVDLVPLIECLKFLELRVLELNSGLPITHDMAIQIANQNPSLEYLTGVFEGCNDIEKQISAEIKAFHPRFREANYSGSDGNSDAMTAYGFDAEGNETHWFHGPLSDEDDDDFMDYDDDYDDDFDAYDGFDDYDSDFDPFGLGVDGNFHWGAADHMDEDEDSE